MGRGKDQMTISVHMTILCIKSTQTHSSKMLVGFSMRIFAFSKMSLFEKHFSITITFELNENIGFKSYQKRFY